MIEENLARLRAHRNNIRRYERLLATQLSDLDRKAAGGRTGRGRSSRQNDISLQSAGA